MDTLFTLTARKAALSLVVSLMAQVERSRLRIILDFMETIILHFHVLSLQHLPRKSGLEEKTLSLNREHENVQIK